MEERKCRQRLLHCTATVVCWIYSYSIIEEQSSFIISICCTNIYNNKYHVGDLLFGFDWVLVFAKHAMVNSFKMQDGFETRWVFIHHTKRPRIERLEAWRANPSILLNTWMYLDATNVAGLQIANANNGQRKAGVNNNNGAAVRTRALFQRGGGRANLVRVVIGHWGVKTIVFLHKKSAIRTFVGYCCSETSGFQARQLVIFTQM